MSKVIEFFTDNEVALKNFPPVSASEILPDWYQDLSHYIHNKKGIDAKYLAQIRSDTPFTAKACIPLADYMKSGYVLRAYSDVLFTPSTQADGLNSWYVKSTTTKVHSHGFYQLPINIGKGKNDYVKYGNPWRIKTPPGYSCLIYQPHYFFNNKISFFPAIVDTDGYHESPISLPGVILTDKTFFINCGDPLVVVFPFKRESWQKKIYFQEQKEFKDMDFSMYFIRAYKRLFHKLKSYK